MSYRQTSMNAVSTNIGAVVFQMLGGYACNAFGWRATFIIYVLLLPSLLATFFLLPEPPSRSAMRMRKSSARLPSFLPPANGVSSICCT